MARPPLPFLIVLCGIYIQKLGSEAEKKELLAKIGDLNMQIEVLQIAREYLGKTLPDANS